MSDNSGVPRDADLARLSRHIAIGEFAASMAHEMRQPLTAILGNAQTCLRLLRSSTPDLAEIEAALTDIVAAGNRADQLLQRNRELLSPQPSNRTPLDINDVIREVASMVRARLQVSGVRISLSLHDAPLVDGDRRELQHVLLNLIANGIEAMSGREVIDRALEIDTDVTGEGNVRGRVSGLGTATAHMPAAWAAARPLGVSSNTTQSSGTTPSRVAARRNRSGAGFTRATSSRVQTAAS